MSDTLVTPMRPPPCSATPPPWHARRAAVAAPPDALITSLAMPIMLMLLFVYLFGGAINTGTKYVTYVVPGVLLLCAGFGSSITAVSVSSDMSSGLVDRLRSLDVGGAAFLAGHVVASVARNATSTVVVFGRRRSSSASGRTRRRSVARGGRRARAVRGRAVVVRRRSSACWQVAGGARAGSRSS